jgi:hypothetical protein
VIVFRQQHRVAGLETVNDSAAELGVTHLKRNLLFFCIILATFENSIETQGTNTTRERVGNLFFWICLRCFPLRDGCTTRLVYVWVI